MIRIYNKIISIFLLLLVFGACDEVDEPYGNQVEIDEPTELTKKAVIFEFTGIHCTNCPQGHAAIKTIDSVYHGHVIPIAVHAGYFAIPYGDDPDFRTPFGDALYADLEEPFTPAAVSGSIEKTNVVVGAPATWQSEVGNIIPDYTKVIVTPERVYADSVVEVTFQLQERTEISNPLLFYAFIIENNIEGPQSGTEISPYIHQHVLRKCISNLSGNSVSFNDGSATLSFSATIQPGWDLNNLKMVGIIVDAVTKEIYTGEMVEILE